MNLPFKKILKKFLKKKIDVKDVTVEKAEKSLPIVEEVVASQPSQNEDEQVVVVKSEETTKKQKKKSPKLSGKVPIMTDRQLENHFLEVSESEGDPIETEEFSDEDTDDNVKLDADGEYFLNNLDNYLSGGVKEEGDGAPRKNRRRKKRQQKPGASIDLHGKTSSVALSRLKSFVVSSRRNNVQVILVVTGKGIHSPDGKSVLRESVETWLNNEGRKMISNYKNAPAKLGGSGALVITLKSR